MTLSPGKSKRRIFLVDDHALVREWLTALINRQPDLAVCGEAAGAPEALQQLPALKPDTVVADLSLQDLPGIALIKSLKKLYPGMPVLVLSIHEEPYIAERALRAGATGYITKREAPREIILGLRRVLQGGLYLSNSMTQALAEKFIEAKTPAEQPAIDQLSERELEVFELLGRGRNIIQISKILAINSKTVHTYCIRIREKLRLDNSTQLLREAFHWHENHPPP